MKNIKFRAFIKDSHEMASLPTSEIYKVTEIDFKDKYVTVEDDKGMIDVVGFEDCELLQFTGMTDNNGIDIYEGDLVRVWGGVEHQECFELDETCEVTFNHGSFNLVNEENVYNDFNMIENIEVIGNMYQSLALVTQ